MAWLYGLFFAVGALAIALGIPPLRRRVKPNLLYGVRTPETLADEAIWYETNVRGGRHLVMLGVGLWLATLALQVIEGLSEPARILTLTGLLLLGVLGMAVADLRFARRRWRERHGSARPQPYGRAS